MQPAIYLIGALLFAASFLPAKAEGNPDTSLGVKAVIESSVHIEWERLPKSDPRYLDFSAKGTPAPLGKGEKRLRVPFGLLVKIKTNDPRKTIKLHMARFKSRDGKETIPMERAFVSINGNAERPLSGDVLLFPFENKREPRELVLLFSLHTTLADQSGAYHAGFSFLTADVP